MDNHECFIGMLNCYEDSDLVTLHELKKHIQREIELNEAMSKNQYFRNHPEYYHKWLSIRDYTDKRKETDLTRFDYCPICGKKINWEDIRRTCDD